MRCPWAGFLWTGLHFLAVVTLLGICAGAMSAEIAGSQRRELTVGVGYTGIGANSPPGSCGCFFLHGGSADAGFGLVHGFDGVIQISGTQSGTVPGSLRGLSMITLMAGPRYTHGIGRLLRMEEHALFGAVRGFDAEFRRGEDATDTMTATSMAFGGSLLLPLGRRLFIRVAQVEYLSSWLSNEGNNHQNNIRFGAGFVLRIGGGLHR